jgi:3-hydroxyisobutyrate dehydrogenase-like beta-hydroxyacid dehydrogenase
MEAEIRKIGFIGLGLMGLPMVKNLLAKTSNETEFFVYDVVDDVMKKLSSEYNSRVSPMSSAKNVAEQAVCILQFVLKKVAADTFSSFSQCCGGKGLTQ